MTRLWLALAALLFVTPAFAQSPGTMALVGPSSNANNVKITPQALDAAINAALALKLDATNGIAGGTFKLTGVPSAPCLSTLADGTVISSGCLGSVPSASLLGGNGASLIGITLGTNLSLAGNVLNATGGGGGGVGTLTSVGLTMPNIFNVTNTPITSSGTIGVAAAGTSGGIPYFNNATSLASSATLSSNAPVIGGGVGGSPTTGTRSGSTTTFATANGTLINGHCVSIDSSGNFVDAGGACTVGGGGGTVSSGTAGQLAVYSATGTVVSGVAPAGDVSAFNVGTGAFTINSLNGGKAVSLAGNLTTSGAFNTTLTMTAATSLTLPTSGTLLTTAGNGSALTGFTYGQLPSLSANSVLGALTGTTPSGLAVPSCSGTANALIWTTGVGFGCNTVAGGGGSGVSSTGTPVASHIATWFNATTIQDGGAVSSITGPGVVAQDNSSNANIVGTGSANGVLMSTGSTTLPTFQSLPMPVSVFMSGIPGANAFVRTILTYNGTLPINLTGSKAIAKAGATLSDTITINKISAGTTTAVGTVVFAAAGGANQTATFTMGSSTSLAPGDMIEFVWPGTADATLSDIAITLAGTHL